MKSFLEFYKAVDDNKMSKEKKKQKRKDSKGRYDRGLRPGDGGLAEKVQDIIGSLNLKRKLNITESSDGITLHFTKLDEVDVQLIGEALSNEFTIQSVDNKGGGHQISIVHKLHEGLPSMFSKKYINRVENEEDDLDDEDYAEDKYAEDDDAEDEMMDDEHEDDDMDAGGELSDDELEDDEMNDDIEDDDMGEEPEDPNRQGHIRFVKGAHLVYKRTNDEGTYDELWIYHLDKGVKDELDIRKAIIAGTDIPSDKTESEDGKQSYELWSAGNAQLVKITGLPN